MTITLKLPDGTSVMNVAIVYAKHGQIFCASEMMDSNAIKDGAVFELMPKKHLPKEEDEA